MQKRTRWAVSAFTAAGLLFVGGATAVVYHSPAPEHATLADSAAALPIINLDNCPTLGLGYHGGCVDQLQSELNSDDNALLSVEGTFGPATRQAVIIFQGLHGVVPSDGIVGPATKTALDAVSTGVAPAPSAPANPAPGTGNPAPSTAPSVPGNSNADGIAGNPDNAIIGGLVCDVGGSALGKVIGGLAGDAAGIVCGFLGNIQSAH